MIFDGGDEEEALCDADSAFGRCSELLVLFYQISSKMPARTGVIYPCHQQICETKMFCPIVINLDKRKVGAGKMPVQTYYTRPESPRSHVTSEAEPHANVKKKKLLIVKHI